MDTVRLSMYLRYVPFEANFQDTHTDTRMGINNDTDTNTHTRRIQEDLYLFLTDTGCFTTTITRFDEYLCQYQYLDMEK